MSAGFQPLPSYGFGPLRRERDASFSVEALPATRPPACPHCGARGAVGFGRRMRDVADLPLHGRPLRLRVQARRFRCAACHRTFYEALPEVDPKRHMTLRLRRWIVREARSRTGVDVAAEAGLAEGTVRQVLRDEGLR
jgi:transposase